MNEVMCDVCTDALIINAAAAAAAAATTTVNSFHQSLAGAGPAVDVTSRQRRPIRQQFITSLVTNERRAERVTLRRPQTCECPWPGPGRRPARSAGRSGPQTC